MAKNCDCRKMDLPRAGKIVIRCERHLGKRSKKRLVRLGLCGQVHESGQRKPTAPVLTALRWLRIESGMSEVSKPSSVLYWSRNLSRRERLRLRLTWAYWRQTRLLYPITDWWLNRGR